MSSEVYNKVHCTDRGGEHSTYLRHVHTMHALDEAGYTKSWETAVSGAAPSERMKGKLTRHDRNGATATPFETIVSRSCEEGRCKQFIL